ncbi:MAG: isoleucine--tRNA ligase [Caldisericia bacterium]|nr:isoleucine--tRNA ligase [Caldisericia bacterium]
MAFKRFETNVDIPKKEEEILNFWKENNIFEKSIDIRKDREKFIFYEGPPTANGKPGVHHVLARIFKDAICRYKTMKGYLVERKGGWDTHGLPVEIEVEKSLGLKNKKDIEKYGIENFIKKCKESVFTYKKEWEIMTERIAFWLDMENPYITYVNEYIETIFWIIKEIYKKGLIYKGYKTVPYCPRCGTTLSSHEVAQGYKDVYDPSIYVKFKIKNLENTFFLVWTTTPWTLPSNLLLAVNKDFNYIKIKFNDEYLILNEERAKEIFKDKDYEIVEKFKGEKLIDLDYQPLFDFVKVNKKVHFVTHGDFVSLEEGTGIVHIAPGYGADDLELGKKLDLPVVQLVNEDGYFSPDTGFIKGKWFKEADKYIIKNLQERGLLFKEEKYLHSYPHCWRCDTPLIYFSKSSWFIKTTDVKENLIKNNQKINWYPEHIKNGRFGNWLETLVDWAISRERYWGTPLPIWKCENCENIEVIGSIEELKEKAINYKEGLDLHRPYIDEIKLRCPKCGKEMIREKEVLDVWLDSGSMPYAQLHYPFENREKFKESFPADYICEAIDQTRGWFFTLHTLGTLLFDSPTFKNCLCLELVLDEKGEKMSKHKGNIVDPWDVLNNEGADAIRWYLFTVTPPWIPRRFSRNAVSISLKNFLIPLRSSVNFFTLYANIDEFKSDKYEHIDYKQRPLMDRWIISRVNSLIIYSTNKLDNYDITDATREMEKFVDELTNWYIRLNRKRFWKGEMDDDKISAYQTLYEVLINFSKMISPFAPFISEEIYQSLKGESNIFKESVHLEDYPKFNSDLIDIELEKRMEFIRDIVELGRSLRKKSNIKIRQPLKTMYINSNKKENIEDFIDLIKGELNIKEVKFIDDEDDFVEINLKPNLDILGKKFGRYINNLKDLLEKEGPYIYKMLLKEKEFEVNFDNFKEKIRVEDLIVEKKPKGNYSVAFNKDITVILSLSIDEELKKEGWLREFLHFIQNTRKNVGLEVTDRIVLGVVLPEEKLEIIKKYINYLKEEALIERIIFGEVIGNKIAFEDGEIYINKA